MRRLCTRHHKIIGAVVIVWLALGGFPPRSIQAAANFYWSNIPTRPVEIDPVSLATTVRLTLNSDDTAAKTFEIRLRGASDGWQVNISTPKVTIPAASGDPITPGSRNITFEIFVPSTAPPGNYTLTARALRLQADGTVEPEALADAFFTVTVKPSPADSTPRVCPERSDPGGDREGASLILVDRQETHGICRIGDEDWFKFGGITDKVYTLAVTQMDKGLDLSLELYDEDGTFLDANDDNTSVVTDTLSTNTKPLIQSFRAPHNGLYFVRVRDTLGIGGSGLGYTFIVRSESYGQDPNTVPAVASVCNDRYEQDGLPELANVITVNETQTDHRLCPVGDADWVKFFALSGQGYTYKLTTDTKPYGRPVGKPEPGADTMINFFGRDGVTLIGTNNNYLTSTLDSEIQFIPTVDGFYYAQIKNVGDTGNQFVRYNLSLQVCLPEQCTPPSSSAGSQSAAEARATPRETSEVEPDPNSDDALFLPLGEGSQPIAADAPPPGFEDIAFARVWQRSDQPITRQRATRSWMWGPKAGTARTESYLQADSSQRQVQYFDKGRMEINNPRGDRDSSWFVTSGLLVIELITGRIQVGDNQFESRTPANIVVAGDLGDSNAPTYASLAAVTSRLSEDRAGQMPKETINRAGKVGVYTGPQRPETRFVAYARQSAHNIPQVFWEYLNTRGIVYDDGAYHTDKLMDWVFAVGYPVSEPYWTQVRIGGVMRDVLVQPFERRLLTYMPEGQRGWRVQMGNVGRHYYQWRYGEDLPS